MNISAVDFGCTLKYNFSSQYLAQYEGQYLVSFTTQQPPSNNQKHHTWH
ncbi:hypothetical protein O1Q79_00441 [Lonepinella sp. MS14434]